MSTIIEKYNAFRAEMEVKKKAYRKEGSKILLGAFQEFFERHPEVETVGWDQYTQYFNDGDTCEFDVYRDYPNINGENEDDHYGEENPAIPQSTYEEVKVIMNILDDDDFEDLFGDHVTVTFNREGYTLDGCNHE